MMKLAITRALMQQDIATGENCSENSNPCENGGSYIDRISGYYCI